MLRIVIWDHHGAGVPFREARLPEHVRYTGRTGDIIVSGWNQRMRRPEKPVGASGVVFISMIPPKVTVMVVLKWNRCFSVF